MSVITTPFPTPTEQQLSVLHVYVLCILSFHSVIWVVTIKSPYVATPVSNRHQAPPMHQTLCQVLDSNKTVSLPSPSLKWVLEVCPRCLPWLGRCTWMQKCVGPPKARLPHRCLRSSSCGTPWPSRTAELCGNYFALRSPILTTG